MLVRGAVPGSKGSDRGGAHRWLSAPDPRRLQDTVDLDEDVFGAPFNGPLVHEVVIAELAARRQGTHATRTRGMVRGGGAKPWRQKGTGRARAGTSRSPLWTGGGTVFGPSPRHYTVKVNRKARKAALRSALSVHAERGSISVLDPARLRRAVDQDAPPGCSTAAAAAPCCVVVAPDQDVAAQVLPQPRARAPCCRPRPSASPTSSAPRSSSSPRRALDALTAARPKGADRPRRRSA